MTSLARRVELTGRVVRPDDMGFAAASTGWNLRFLHKPAVIVYARETEDVLNAVTWARHNEIPIRVRSGGHSLEGWSSVDNGVVIDVSEMKSVTIDRASRMATVGAGLTQAEAVAAFGTINCATPTGTEGSVGLAGATLGGGFGLLTRLYGMACDNLVAADIVVASPAAGAEVITVDESNHADLLWALRGAGNGQFGIVTSLTYRLHTLATATCVTASWTGLRDLQPIADSWQQSAPHADNRLTSQLEIHRDRIVLFGVLASGSESAATRMLEPILSLGAPTVSTHTAGWVDTYTRLQIPTSDEAANWKFLSQFVSAPFPAEAVDVIGSFMSTAPTPESNYFTNALGGAVGNSEPSGGSAFAHRNALFYAEPGAGWGTRDGGMPAVADPMTATAEAWVTEFGEALAPYVGGAYVNVPNTGILDWEAAYWGAGVDRLRLVKATYDPNDVFAHEQSVQPD